MVDDGNVHIFPVDDGHPGVVVHNAFDKRENLEQITGRGDGRGWKVSYPIK
jgi:hypothetical protein